MSEISTDEKFEKLKSELTKEWEIEKIAMVIGLHEEIDAENLKIQKTELEWSRNLLDETDEKPPVLIKEIVFEVKGNGETVFNKEKMTIKYFKNKDGDNEFSISTEGIASIQKIETTGSNKSKNTFEEWKEKIKQKYNMTNMDEIVEKKIMEQKKLEKNPRSE